MKKQAANNDQLKQDFRNFTGNSIETTVWINAITEEGNVLCGSTNVEVPQEDRKTLVLPMEAFHGEELRPKQRWEIKFKTVGHSDSGKYLIGSVDVIKRYRKEEAEVDAETLMK